MDRENRVNKILIISQKRRTVRWMKISVINCVFVL